MRIALSGHSGTGKTTICESVAKGVGIATACNLTRHTMTRLGIEDSSKIKKQDILNVQLEVIQDRIKHISCRDNLITDRCGLDWLTYTLLLVPDLQDTVWFNAAVDLAIQELNCYDLVITLPYIETVAKDANRKGLFVNPIFNLKARMMIQGFAEHLLNKTTAYIVDVPEFTNYKDLTEVVYENITADFPQFRKYLKNT